MAGHLVDRTTTHYVATHDILADTGIGIETADVQRLILEQGRVAAVQLADGATVQTSAVVVAAGAFDTPILLHRSGIRPQALGLFRAGVEPQWMTLGFAHVMGTCRMGASDDGTCVTDPFGQVWGTENLYLATVGVIPTALAVNPTLTGAALAIRSADRLLAG
jgi:choline dehydrogenase-like flavoprotein